MTPILAFEGPARREGEEREEQGVGTGRCKCSAREKGVREDEKSMSGMRGMNESEGCVSHIRGGEDGDQTQDAGTDGLEAEEETKREAKERMERESH